MTQIINPQGYIEDEQNGGRMNVVSSDMTDAKIDPQGYFYKEETINGITGRMPVISVEGMEAGGEPPVIPTLQEVTEAGAVTTNPITAGQAYSDTQMPTLGQVKSTFIPRSDKSTINSMYVHHNVLMWQSAMSSATGIIEILLQRWNSTMLQFEIDFYNHNTSSGGSKLLISGYNAESGYAWNNTSVSVVGLFPYSIRLGYNPVAGKCNILLGNATSVWTYPALAIRSVKTSVTGFSSSWTSGYSASLITTETGLTGIVTPFKLGYEEGSWTPSLEGGTTSGTANYTTRVAQYIKIGRKVTISLNIVGSFTTAPVGQALIRGLPFTPALNAFVCDIQSSYTVPTISATIGVGAATYIGLGIIPSDINGVIANAVFGTSINNSVFNIRLSSTYIATT